MAAGDTFEIEIHGKGGHAATPYLTVDPLITGAQVLLNLQHSVSRQVDPMRPAVVTVATFEGGDSFNVIPDSARDLFDHELIKHIPAQMGMEEFAYHLNEVPGTFFGVGGTLENDVYPHNHPKFNVDERAMISIITWKKLKIRKQMLNVCLIQNHYFNRGKFNFDKEKR